MDKEKITPSDFKNFIEDIGVIASGSKIYTDGIQYVNNASFWKWITQSYSNSQFLNSGDSMKNFINLHKDQIKGIKSLIQGKTLEWEIFQKYRPNFIDINNLPLDTNAQISDVNSFNPFSGINTEIQVKTSFVNQSGVAKSLIEKYPETTKFGVNKSLYDEAIKQGIPKERFVKVIPDDELKSLSRNNFENASKGSVDIGITMKGLLNEVGKGALIGTVVYIGISAFSNYKKYKNGDMTYNEFGRTLLKDGSKGGVMGGSMAAINTGIQWSFVKLGLGAGNPLAIPVMIIVSYGLKKIIDPLFKDGQYAETLNSIRYYDDLAKGWLNFGKMSFYLYENQIKQLETIQIYKNRSENINKLSSLIDDNLENKIKEI